MTINYENPEHKACTLLAKAWDAMRKAKTLLSESHPEYERLDKLTCDLMILMANLNGYCPTKGGGEDA